MRQSLQCMHALLDLYSAPIFRLSVTLMSRLVLNLRAMGERDTTSRTTPRYTNWIARDIAMFASGSMFSNHSGASEDEDAGEVADLCLVSSIDSDGFAESYTEEVQVDGRMEMSASGWILSQP